ncbi:DGAT1/2-independent enzyme synthesizing storage lipids [Pogona vitticeps]
MNRVLFDFSFLPKMAAENTNYTLELQLPVWSTYLLEGCQHFMIYPLTMLAILIVLYYPLLFSFSVLYMGSAYYAFCRKLYDLPDDIKSEQWRKPRKMLALVSDVVGKLLHGYEVCGIENLPEGPAILLYYHGALTVDYYLLVLRIYRLTGRFCYSVVDHLLFNMPGLQRYFHINYCSHPTREDCVELLRKGNLVGIAPGGLREQNYGDHTYKLVWGKRKGFAQVAIDAKVPIIPVFTQNIREGYRTYGRIRIMKWIYERTRTIFFPVYGLIPVKLWTHIGQPIPYDPNITADELAEKAKKAVEALRDKHQKIPGSILRALWERFEVHHKDE